MSLWHIFQTNRDRIIHKWTHYFPIYENHFERYINRPLLFIEIGCGEGGSLQMWKKYFGPFAKIIGIDVREECKSFEEDQIYIRIGDQKDPGFISSLLHEFGTPDIVLDDGSHIMSDVAKSFELFYPKISPNGIYMVEDLHTAYWEEYEGGLNRNGTFIEISKQLIDQLNADHTRTQLSSNDFTASTLSMHYYDSVLVFEKGSHIRKYAPQIGAQ